MKRWIVCLLCLLLLCGCSSEPKIPTVEKPWSMTVEYGESSVVSEPWGWSWNRLEGEQTVEDNTTYTDPKAQLKEVPFVNRSAAGELTLQFAQQPDRLQVQYWTAEDSYSEPFPMEIDGSTIAAPTDDVGYLFEVIATWRESDDRDCWGKGIYYFRYLPQGDTGEANDLPLYRLLQLDSMELFGIEMVNQQLAGRKICRKQMDVGLILAFLQEHLVTDFVQSVMPMGETDYVMRLLITDGSQLTIGYVEEEGEAWLLLGGIPYEAEPMNLDSLWESLETETEYETQQPVGEYLRVEEQYPEEEWGGSYVYGYLRNLGETAIFDEMLWVDDEAEPNGYRLEAGESAQILTLAEDCQYWILERHWSPCCQVEQHTLIVWEEEAGYDVLFRFYVKDQQIVAICEHYVP